MPSNVAFFGATGGCANYALALALKNGDNCSVLARNPEKLRTMLLANGVPSRNLDTNLTVVKGDVQVKDNVKAVLTANASRSSEARIDLIVSGIGMTLGKGVLKTICQTATKRILEVLDELKPAHKPLLALISSTGIASCSGGRRDVPYALIPLYYAMLQTPHADKTVMEKMVVDAAQASDAPIAGYTLIRPTMLVNSKEPKGMQNIRVGTEQEPSLGYTISRKDVGLWIFEELIKGDSAKWINTKPTLA